MLPYMAETLQRRLSQGYKNGRRSELAQYNDNGPLKGKRERQENQRRHGDRSRGQSGESAGSKDGRGPGSRGRWWPLEAGKGREQIRLWSLHKERSPADALMLV